VRISKDQWCEAHVPCPTALLLSPGDIERQTGGSFYNRKLAESLIERGFRLDVVAVPDLPYFAGLVAGLAIAPMLLLRLARRKYDVVIEDGWAHPATLLFNAACWMSGAVRLVIIVHQVRWLAMSHAGGFVARIFERIALRCAQLIVVVSTSISGEVEELIGSSERIALALPGSAPLSDPTGQQGKTKGAPLRLLFVGNCTRLKGLDYLIQALGLLRDLSLTLDLVGDVGFEPRYYKKLVRQARALGVSERVAFHGATPHEELGRFYSRADIFTFPSVYEGFGIVLAEAMHAGLPIVATRTGAADEILRQGENALIVPAANLAALATAIRRLAVDREMRERFGRRSLELADSLPTWKQTCEIVCDRIEIMIRTSPDKTQKTKKIPRL